MNLGEAKKVLITGVSGQDGSNMVRFLLKNTDYEIYGAIRRLSVTNHENILDIVPTSIHQRVPLYIGSKEMVQTIQNKLASQSK